MATVSTTLTEIVFDEGEVMEFRVPHDGHHCTVIWDHGAVTVTVKPSNFSRATITKVRCQKRSYGIPGKRREGEDEGPWERMLIRSNQLMRATRRWCEQDESVTLEELVKSI